MVKKLNTIPSIEDEFLFNPLVKADKDKIVYDSRLLEQIFKCVPFNDIFSGTIIDFNTVYKFPKLKQTNYNVDLTPKSITIATKGVAKTHNCAVMAKKIKILRERGKKTLNDYLDSYANNKKTYLHYFTKDIGDSSINKYIKLGSKKVSQLLSSQADWSEKGKIKGNENIFESDELLDQLLITYLINKAREGVDSAVEILMALLYKRIEYQVDNIWKQIKHKDKEDVLNQAVLFVSRVIKDDETLAERFRFINREKLNLNKTSLRYFLAGKSFSESEKSGFFTKINEYFKDLIKTDYSKSNKDDLSSYKEKNKNNENKEEKEDKIDKIEDKKNDIISMVELRLVHKKINNLPTREREIIIMFSEGILLDDIGKKFGIKRARVSQILSKIRNDLKN